MKVIRMTEPLYDYLLSVSLRDTPAQAALREKTAELPNSGMQISPDQGQFMAFLVKLVGARRALEVGTFTGYSALSVAKALPDDGRLVACDMSHDWTNVGRAFWEEADVAHKIDLRLGPAVETLQGLLEAGERERFDFAFIDADKTNYDTYYEHCLALLRPGGLIAVDNVLWGGAVVDETQQDADLQAIRALNRKIHADPRVDLSMVPVGDGLTLARKR